MAVQVLQDSASPWLDGYLRLHRDGHRLGPWKRHPSHRAPLFRAAGSVIHHRCWFPNATTGLAERLPTSDPSGLNIWAQRAAIFNTAAHPNAQKLYMNWLLSVDYQTMLATGGWSVRNDIPSTAGLQRMHSVPS